MSKKKLKVGIIAAEHSGDRLGSKLLEALQNNFQLELFGLGGPQVNANQIVTPEGVNYQDLHVMGLIDPLIHLPRILSIRKKLFNLFTSNDIDIFIGVDSPDFNMFFHKNLKCRHIKTIQVVSPSVWGWRENRIHNIKAYVDLTMCLFKFECNFYEQKNMESFFLGHPFSKLKPRNTQEIISRHSLDYSNDFISILPGSRKSEIFQLMPLYIESAKKLLEINSNTFFLIPAANKKLAELIESIKGINEIPYKLAYDSAQDFLTLSPISIVTSGTATLEAAVLSSVPIICYKTNKLNYAILSRLIKTPYVGLPNLLLQEQIFPELIQHDLTSDSIVQSFQEISSELKKYQSHFLKLNDSMQGKGFEAAANAISNLL